MFSRHVSEAESSLGSLLCIQIEVTEKARLIHKQVSYGFVKRSFCMSAEVSSLKLMVRCGSLLKPSLVQSKKS